MSLIMFVEQLKTALTIAWLIVSLALLIAVVGPFVLPADVLFRLAPGCEARAEGHECAFCGMTTAFIMIGHGLPGEAWRANRGSLPLFSVLVWNECVALWFVVTALARVLLRRPVRVILRTREDAGPQVQTEETSCKS